MKNLVLSVFIFLLSTIAFGGYGKTCDINTLVPIDRRYTDIEDVRSSADYIVFNRSTGPCVFTMRPCDQYPEYSFKSLDSATFSMYTGGQDFCVKSGSTWRIFRAGNSSPHHVMDITRVDEPELYNASLSAIRDLNPKVVTADGRFTFMMCPK